MSSVKNEQEIIDIDLLLRQKSTVRKIQQENSIPWGPQKYDPAKYLAKHKKCDTHPAAQYLELHSDESMKLICGQCLLLWFQRDHLPKGMFGHLVDKFLVAELCNRLEKGMKFFDTQPGESFVQESLIVCEEFCQEMQGYICQVFDELYKELVEMDPYEVKVAN